MNFKTKLITAVGNNPTSIITVLGSDYKSFVANLISIFGLEYGKFVAVQLQNNKQDCLYKTFFVKKKRSRKGKRRKIYAPSEILLALQQIAATFVSAQFEDHHNSHGFVEKRSCRTAAETFITDKQLDKKVLTNIDVRGAFNAVKGNMVRSLLKHKTTTVVLTPWQIEIFAKLVTNSSDELAIGAGSSPVFFNWKMTSFDHELEKACKKRNWKIARFADDISVLHYPSQKGEVVKLFIKLLKQVGLDIAREKLKSYYKHFKKILGLVIEYGIIRPPKKRRLLVRAISFYSRKRYPKIISANSWTKDQIRNNIVALAPMVAYLRSRRLFKGSLEAHLLGFMAYFHDIESYR